MKKTVLHIICIFWAGVAVCADWNTAKQAFIDEDYKTAFENAKVLANAGDDKAQLLMATLYQYGLAVDRDLEKAVEYTGKAYENGNTQIRLVVGLRNYYEGDIDGAIAMIQSAVDLGDAQAQYMLAQIYAQQFPKDDDYYIKRILLLEQAARQDHVQAQLELALSFYELGVPDMFDEMASMWVEIALSLHPQFAQFINWVTITEDNVSVLGWPKPDTMRFIFLPTFEALDPSNNMMPALPTLFKSRLSEAQQKNAYDMAVQCRKTQLQDCGK